MRKADNLPPYCAVVKKSGSLNFLDPSGSAQACYGRTLPFFYSWLLRTFVVLHLRFAQIRVSAVVVVVVVVVVAVVVIVRF